MLSKNLSGFTSLMIYIGTFLLSVLSFFTTFYGMTILLNKPLALLGSLGLQIAMLGIAWNLMKIKDNRIAYVSVFCMAAAFSIFFSYANFDTNLRENTRVNFARKNYTEAARPILADYRNIANKAAMQSRYQVERLNTPLKLEQDKGWATVMDEGSGDLFIQEVLDGARHTVDSWKKATGVEYKQGKGEGIIYNYFESKILQAQNNNDVVTAYMTKLDRSSQALNSELKVQKQHELVNTAWAFFPTSEIAMILSVTPVVPMPPNRVDFIEQPQTRQQAFMLVINDFVRMDNFALFSLLLAFAIDFIVILMAFVGSYMVDDIDYFMNRVRQDTVLKLKKLSLDDSSEVTEFLDNSIKRVRRAGEFGVDLSEAFGEYANKKKMSKIVMKRQGEEIEREASAFSRHYESRINFDNSISNQNKQKKTDVEVNS